MEKNRSDIRWILDNRKKTVTLGTGANGMNTGPQLTTQNISEWNTIPQQIITESSLEIDSMTDEIFGVTASMETNYHIASDEIDRIFDGNEIHCTEVKHSTSDYSEQLKD